MDEEMSEYIEKLAIIQEITLNSSSKTINKE